METDPDAGAALLGEAAAEYEALGAPALAARAKEPEMRGRSAGAAEERPV